MVKKFINQIFKGHKRTVKARKNILASFALKGVSIIIGFLLIRVTLDYLDQTRYGVWLTLTSFLTWFTFFEIGLGNGLKNKLAEALATNEYELAKTYVSTTYVMLSSIIIVLAFIFFIFNYSIDWNLILNVDVVGIQDLFLVTQIIFGFFFLQFVLKLIGTILMADQRPAVANSFGPIGNLISLILIVIIKKFTVGSLIYLAWILSLSPVIVLTFSSLYFFNKDYYKISPSLKSVDFSYARDLLSLGFKFFIIQISALLMFQSSNILIAQFYGPDQVTSYNIAHKLFSVIMMLFTIIISPFWTAFTEAWTNKEINWIKKTIKNLIYVWFGLVLLSFVLFAISEPFFSLWLGSEKMLTIKINNSLKISLIIYFLLFTFGGIFNMFINGVGKLKVQMISLLIGAILFIPITLIFVKYLHWGIESVVIAMIIANFYSPFIAPVQYYRLINNKAKGIWNQ